MITSKNLAVYLSLYHTRHILALLDPHQDFLPLGRYGKKIFETQLDYSSCYEQAAQSHLPLDERCGGGGAGQLTSGQPWRAPEQPCRPQQLSQHL